MVNSFPTERTSFSQNFQFPSEGEVIFENPPTFIWIPVDGAENYTLTVYDGDEIFEQIETRHTYANLTKLLEAKDYSWTVETDTGLLREKMSFSVSEDAIHFERPTAEEVFNSYPVSRPSYIFSESDIQTLLDERKSELEAIRRNVEVAFTRPLPEMPTYHHRPYSYEFKLYFSEHRLYCDRDLIACALLFALTGDEAAGKKGVELLLKICDLNPHGPCSVDGWWDDETGISNIRCLPAAFDMLYPLLSDRLRGYVASIIAIYASQCENKLKKINYEQNPSNSHAGRVPAYLGGAALVLKGAGVVSDETLKSWLSYALDIYCGIFPYYGGNDGSWAEGIFYATSYCKWFLPFFSAVERYTGKSLFNRPFYHRYTNFLLHFCNHKYENFPFCDGYWEKPLSKEWPGFFAQNPYTVYADKFGPELAIKKCKEYSNQDIYYLHLLDLFLPTLKKEKKNLAKEPSDVAVFPDGGFVAMHTDFESNDDICVMARASRFSHDSHRHKDQGSFALFCGGVSLVSPSGYYGIGYGTNHHTKWTNSSKAHNTILVDGMGQENVPILEAVGRILNVDEDNKTAVLDMSTCYPDIEKWQRILKLEDGCLTVNDEIEADKDVEITYCIHTLSQPLADGNKVKVERKGVKMDIIPDNSLSLFEICDKFDVDVNDGQPEEFHVETQTQYHIYYKTKKAKSHLFEVKYIIEK